MSLRLRSEPTSSSSSSSSSGSPSSTGSSNALAASSTPSGDGITADQRSAGIGNDTRRQVYEEHRTNTDRANADLGDHAWSADRFMDIWTANQARYERVASATGVPAELIAALHFRESSGNFNTYLHNGQPLGQTTTIVPVGVFFTDWEEAAIDALRSKAHIANDLSMTAETDDMAAMATYAEYYNGLGYHYRGYESAYVYAGTDVYTGGKFVADGVFDPNAMDQQLGVVAMLQLARGEIDQAGNRTGARPEQGQGPTPESPTTQPPTTGGATSLRDGPMLRRGSKGADVSALQAALTSLGNRLTVDGDFGQRTESAVRSYQAGRGLTVDGVVGPQTRGSINGALATSSPTTEEDTAPQRETPPETTAPDLSALMSQLGSSNLRRGSRGGTVSALQQILNSLGQRLSVDGDFGGLTESAVRSFQSSRGLTVDGIVGGQTRGAFSSASGSGTTRPPQDTGPAEEGDVGPEVPTTGVGDTDTERKLDTFFQAFNGIPIRVNPSESVARYVDVIPSYHINTGARLSAALAERGRNPAVNSIISRLPGNARVGKADPGDIKFFLEESIKGGHVADTSARGLRDHLARFGVSTDCSGLVTQALNYLHDGNLDVESGDPLNPSMVGSGSLKGGVGQFDRVSSPRNLLAGDTMHVPGHIRILIDVDMNGNGVDFRTIEATPREDVVDNDQRDANDRERADGGIGDIHWRYTNSSGFSGLERSADAGRTWSRTSESPTYGRWRNMPAA